MPLDLKDLTAAKIAAMEAGQNLNVLVAESFGDDVRAKESLSYIMVETKPRWTTRLVPRVSTDANAAMEALGRLVDGYDNLVEYNHSYSPIEGDDEPHDVCICGCGNDPSYADTFPLAAARAILAWWLAQQKESGG